MDKIEGYCKQNGVPTPSIPVPVEKYYKAIINGKEFVFKDDLKIKEVYEKDGKWYIEWR